MIRIAIVGDIGSGKSYVAKLFGYPVFNADVEVAKLYKENKKCFKKINKQLPSYIKSFPIKKIDILKAIIANEHNLKKIIKIVHPEVRANLIKFLKKNNKKKLVVLDIPLLLENKINKKNDVLIFIDARKKEINKRLRKRKNFNNKILKKFNKLQLPLEFKKKRSHYTIKNNFKIKPVKKSVKKVLEKILLNA